MARGVPKSMLFRACIYPSEDVKRTFVAHCLELDVIGEGQTPIDAICELAEAIEIQIQTCRNISEILFFAPASVLQKYKQGKNAGRVLLQRVVKEAIKRTRQMDYVPEFDNIVATADIPAEYYQMATN